MVNTVLKRVGHQILTPQGTPLQSPAATQLVLPRGGSSGSVSEQHVSSGAEAGALAAAAAAAAVTAAAADVGASASEAPLLSVQLASPGPSSTPGSPSTPREALVTALPGGTEGSRLSPGGSPQQQAEVASPAAAGAAAGEGQGAESAAAGAGAAGTAPAAEQGGGGAGAAASGAAGADAAAGVAAAAGVTAAGGAGAVDASDYEEQVTSPREAIADAVEAVMAGSAEQPLPALPSINTTQRHPSSWSGDGGEAGDVLPGLSTVFGGVLDEDTRTAHLASMAEQADLRGLEQALDSLPPAPEASGGAASEHRLMRQETPPDPRRALMRNRRARVWKLLTVGWGLGPAWHWWCGSWV